MFSEEAAAHWIQLPHTCHAKEQNKDVRTKNKQTYQTKKLMNKQTNSVAELVVKQINKQTYKESN